MAKWGAAARWVLGTLIKLALFVGLLYLVGRAM